VGEEAGNLRKNVRGRSPVHAAEQAELQVGSGKDPVKKRRVRLDVDLSRETYDRLQSYRLYLRRETGRKVGSRTVLREIIEHFFSAPVSIEEKK
jgi:hypothetical protein